MMIIYQETSIVGSLFFHSRSLSLCFFMYVSFAFLMRVSVIRLHQTLFFSRIVINSFTEEKGGGRERERERERERDRARGADKTFIEVVLCDGLSVVR